MVTTEESWLRQPLRSPGVIGMHLLWVWLVIVSPGRSEALTGPQEVTGYQEGSLMVQCHYEDKYVNNDKYWCKGGTRLCTVVVATRSSPGHSSGRFSISDNPATRTFTVTMLRLNEEDAGVYQCGIITWGFDPLFRVRVTVLQATTAVYHSSRTAQFIDTITERKEPTHSASSAIFDPTKEPAPMATSSEETILLYLLPAVGVLLLLLLLTALLLVRSQRRKKQDRRDTLNNNSQLSDMFPDALPGYAEVMKHGGSHKTGIQNIAMEEDLLEGGYEQIQVLPRVSDPVPVYAVVQKPGASQIHGIQNNTKNVLHQEHCYENIQEVPRIPHTIPIYAVVKKKTGATRKLEIESDAMYTVRKEIDYEEIQKPPSTGPTGSFH